MNEHYRAPSNIEATCHLCGEAIRPDEIIIDLPEHGDMTVAHDDCVLDELHPEAA